MTSLIGEEVNGEQNAGLVAIFDVATGAELSLIEAPAPALNDFFGVSIDIDGDTLVVGAQNTTLGDGSAYLYDIGVPTAPILLHQLTPSDAATQDGMNSLFGKAVAIDGDTCAVGAPLWGPSASGAVYVFDVTSGQESSQITSPSIAPARFGHAVDVDGTTLAVGAYQATVPGFAVGSGAGYVVDLSDARIHRRRSHC